MAASSSSAPPEGPPKQRLAAGPMRSAHGKARLAWGQPENEGAKTMATKTNTKKTQQRETAPPALIAWHVTERGEKKFWTRIGACWEHEDGERFFPAPRSLPRRRRARRSPHAEGEKRKTKRLKAATGAGSSRLPSGAPASGGGRAHCIERRDHLVLLAQPEADRARRLRKEHHQFGLGFFYGPVHVVPFLRWFRLRALGTAAGPESTRQGRNAEEELHACPLARR